jgi:ubiquinone/menaquinone biosynthesis C-methylase UbiE
MLIKESRFWRPLWQHYNRAPSVAFCRVPELEFASALGIKGKFLDHCCGDGLFASMAWNMNSLSAGCDISAGAINVAKKRRIYDRADICDASQKLPYETNSFDLVFNNSALEHIRELGNALQEVARVLKPGGEFCFNVLNHRYFEWWPLDHDTLLAYREWQPFCHALAISEWSERLAEAGFRIQSFQGYFNQRASQWLAKMDYLFSGFYIRGMNARYVKLYLRLRPLTSLFLKRELEKFEWPTDPDGGAGYFIKAIKKL